MNITKLLYLFLIILFIIILIIVIFKTIIPLIGAGIEIKGYIGNLKGNFDIEISKNSQISEEEENNDQYGIDYQPTYIPSEYKEQNSQYDEELPLLLTNEDIPSSNFKNTSLEEDYITQNEEDNSNIDRMMSDEKMDNLNVIEAEIEEEVNNNLLFNSYIPLTKLNDYIMDEENIIESFNSEGNYDKPIFVMFYTPWCTFSKKALPDFQNLKENYQGKIAIALVNCDEEKEIAIKHKVQQYPTIRYYPNGMNVPQYVDYNKDRDYNSYIQYLKSVTDTII